MNVFLQKLAENDILALSRGFDISDSAAVLYGGFFYCSKFLLTAARIA